MSSFISLIDYFTFKISYRSYYRTVNFICEPIDILITTLQLHWRAAVPQSIWTDRPCGEVQLGKVKGRKYAEEGTWSGHAHQDFGRWNTGQTWEIWNKKIKEGREVHGRKEYRDVKRNTLEEGHGAGMLNKILGGECGTKREVRRNEESAGGRKYGNVERDTNKTTIVGGNMKESKSS